MLEHFFRGDSFNSSQPSQAAGTQEPPAPQMPEGHEEEEEVDLEDDAILPAGLRRR